VRELYHRLRADGFEPWLDEEELLPGQKWQKEIPKAVAAANVVIVCLSQAALTKAGYVQEEIKFALDIADRQPEETIFLIPLKLEECDVPDRLAGLHWVNFFEQRDFERLLRALRTKAEEKSKREVKNIETEASVEPQPKSLPLTVHLANLLLSWRSPTSHPSSSLPKTLPRRFDFEPEMILIPAGEFLLGSDPKKDEYAHEDEQPQHTLYLPNYYMAKAPVTNAQYAAFVKTAGYKPPQQWNNKQPPLGKENHPVEEVSWNHALTYCRWLAKTTGQPYRLPTEAEWEKGARGTDGRIYPWGDQWDAKRCNSRENGKGDTTPVDTYLHGASPYSLLDIAGNVGEWCSTIWQKKAYPFQAQGKWTKAYLLRTNVPCVLRGGAYYYDEEFARCAFRSESSPDNRHFGIGFRIVSGCPHPTLASDLSDL
jgi:formylglycine-generating enzyme required for sulfatase activity